MEDQILTGKCTSMCSAREMKWREKESLLHKFEILEGTESSSRARVDVNKAVTQYSRPAAGRRSVAEEELRPPRVLLKTVLYLVQNIVPRTDVPWVVVYDFVSDRLRAVCQELTIQRARGSESKQILTYCVKFYLYSSCRSSSNKSTLYDSHINSTLLLECTKRLLTLYQECDSASDCRGYAEIEAIYLTYNFGSTEAHMHALSLPKSVRLQSLLRISTELSSAYSQGNTVRVLRTFAHLPPVLQFGLHGHLQGLRRSLLSVLCVAYSSKNSAFPVCVLCRWLGMEGQAREVVQLCRHYGLALTDDEKYVFFVKGRFNGSAKAASLKIEPSLVPHLNSFSSLFE